jgi:NarL family two-component system response regulator LiaR
MTETRPIRVLIVDDHAMLRRGLVFFLKGFEDLDLVGEAASGREAIARCVEVQPDVVLMDMIMPEMDGAETTERLLARWPDTKVIVLTSFQEEDLVVRALRAGAKGYLLKNTSATNLAQAIRDAYAGHTPLAPEATEALVQATRQQTPSRNYDLTDREHEVLALLAEGLSNADIAERLVVSVATVKFHVHGVLTKLGVSSRTEAVALAWHEKLLDR